jgi:hypothetical protein
MVHHDGLPVMQIDAQTFEVRAAGQWLACEPATVLPMVQRCFLVWHQPPHLRHVLEVNCAVDRPSAAAGRGVIGPLDRTLHS